MLSPVKPVPVVPVVLPVSVKHTQLERAFHIWRNEDRLTMPMSSSSMAGTSVVGGVTAAGVKNILHLVDEAGHDYGLKDVFFGVDGWFACFVLF